MPATLPCIALLVKVSNEFDQHLGVYLQQTVHKRPKIVLSDAMKTLKFENLGTKSWT